MSTDWKAQYLEAVDEQEQLRKRYARKTELLGRGLQVTGQLAFGNDEKTDRGLIGLRGLMRKDSITNADLDLAVTALEKQLQPALALRSKTTKAVLDHLKDMLAKFQLGDESAVSAEQLRQLKRQLKSGEMLFADLSTVMQVLAELPQQAPVVDAPGGSLWSKLFGSAQAAEPIITPAAAMTGVSADTMAPTSQTGTGLNEELMMTLRQVLEKLLHQVNPPPGVMASYEAVNLILSQELDQGSVTRALEHLCEVMLACIQRDQDEFEAFLKTLNERLQAAQSQLSAGLKLNAEAGDAEGALSRTMRDHVSAFATSVAAARDIDSLKTEVSRNLEQIVGTMDSYSSDAARRQAQMDQELSSMAQRLAAMEQASKQAAAQIEVQRQLAMHDGLTRLPNRAAYDQRAAEELARWQRHRAPLCMAVTDVDFFKKVNDTYGHAVGDQVLRVLAKLLRKRVRSSDFVARYGGEEFVVLLPETTVEQAVNVMNEVREAVAAAPVEYGDDVVAVTVSVGVTAFGGQDNVESAFARADRALYDAKQAGRNCCRFVKAAAEPSAPT